MSHVIASCAAPQAACRSPEVRIERFDDFDQFEQSASAWNDLLEQSGSDVYFTIDWMRIWWRHYGKGRTLRILLARDGDRLVGGLPLCIRKIGLGPLGIRLAQLVGADSTIPVLTPPIMPGYEETVMRPFLDMIVNDWGVEALSLSPLSSISTVGAGVQSVCRRDHTCTVVCDQSIGPHTSFSLPDSFDVYLASLAKRQRSNYRRDVNLLKKTMGLEQRLYRGQEAVEQFDRFVELHREQWRATGLLGHFEDWPCSEVFNRDIVEKMAAKGNVYLFELIGKGETLAMQHCFVFGDVCCWRLPARRAGPAFDRLGLGRVGLVNMIEGLIELGVRRIEAGPGHYEYKLNHGGEEHQLTRILVARRGIIPKLKLRTLLLWANFLHLVYYRIWFIKIAPRLRLQRSLWRAWIRTRI